MPVEYYSEQDIIGMCEEHIKNVASFYSKDFINYRSSTIHSQKKITEVVAGFILEHIEDFEKIPVISRKSSYDANHDGFGSGDDNSEDEEIIAKKLFRQKGSFAHIGNIFDYQVPLKDSNSDIGVGKIDLISFEGKTIRILEFKRANSPETMLRCVLEGYTYLKTVDQAKLVRDYIGSGKIKGDADDIIVMASPLVYKSGAQWKEWQEDCSNLRKLMDKWNIKPFFIVEEDGRFSITDK